MFESTEIFNKYIGDNFTTITVKEQLEENKKLFLNLLRKERTIRRISGNYDKTKSIKSLYFSSFIPRCVCNVPVNKKY
jgi:hypothetical protein